MSFIFDCVYALAMIVAAPWLLYSAVRRGRYRAGWSKKLLGRVPRRQSQRRCVWLHAVSVGEVNLLGTLLAQIESKHPECDVVISTTTAAGYDLARKRYAPRSVFYAPLDFSWAVRAALERIRPDLLILAELEVWPNLVRFAKQRGVRVAVVNGRLSDNSFRGYKRFNWLLRPTFAAIDVVCAQNEEYAGRFRTLGCPADRVVVTGSLKFDGARSDRANPATRSLAELAGIAADDVVFLAGSTQSPEESLALDAFEALAGAYPKLKLILVPRHPERFQEVADLLDRRGVAWQRRSALGDSPGPRILLVDAVGELGAWWGAAKIAFVGGSMGSRGGQNMIEPAAYGAAVSFGPNTWNFRDSVALLLAHRAAEVVGSGEELTAFVRRCLRDPDYANQLGARAAAVVASQQGATGKTMKAHALLLPTATQRRAA